jgi:tRNA pseudouridine55 synthase
MRGFINIDKPQGITSFDVVKQIRRAAGIRKVGHAGTLDPNATGVLPVAIAEATRFIEHLVAARKNYRATLTFGVATDTYDADGAVESEADASGVTAEALTELLPGFVGQIMQTPPPYSAVKRQGEPAYRAARRGDPLDLEPRPVEVDSIDLTGFEAGHRAQAILEVRSGKGFYVRSLAHELGQLLGVGAHLSELCRTAVGPFRVEDATSLDAAVALLEAGETRRIVHQPDVVLTNWPAVLLDRRQVAEARKGRDIFVRPRRSYLAAGRDRARCYGPDGELVALLEAGPGVGIWHPYRVLPAEQPVETMSQ